MLTLSEFAERKRLDKSFLQECGLQDTDRGLCFPYYGPNRECWARRYRSAWDQFYWEKGTKPQLYGLWHGVPQDGQRLLLVEGESDTLTAWQHGIRAFGVPGSSAWRDEWRPYLGRSRPVLILEPDRGGQTLLRHLALSLHGVWYVELGFKDLSEMYLALGDGFLAAFKERLAERRCCAEPAPEPLWRPRGGFKDQAQGMSCLDLAGGQTRLLKKGKDWWGKCPLHEEKQPSFHIDEKRNVWKCFSCGQGGGPVKLAQLLNARDP